MTTRRTFLRGIAASGALGLLGHGVLRLLRKDLSTVGETRLLMGTLVNLRLVGEDPTRTRLALGACFQRMEDLERCFSRHRPDGEVARLNAEGRLTEASPGLVALVQSALELSHATEGAFDPTVLPLLCCHGTGRGADLAEARRRVGFQKLDVGSRSLAFAEPGMGLTLDALAKGHIVDQGASVLREHGFQHFFLEAEGDLVAEGPTPWRLGLQSPRGRGTLAAFPVKHRALATSGDYQHPHTGDFREHHIVDPRTGHSAPHLASASVLAPTAAQADALATALMVMEPRAGLALLATLPNVDACLVSKAGDVVRTPGFPGA